MSLHKIRIVTTKQKRLNKLIITIIVLVLLNPAAVAQTAIRGNIRTMAEKLQKDNQVHFGYAVGYGGKPETNNKYYKLYQKLKSSATTQELVELANSTSPVLVVYAFDILHGRNY